MDRNGLWVGLIVQVFLFGWGFWAGIKGIEEGEMLRIVLGFGGCLIMLFLIIASIKKLKELY